MCKKNHAYTIDQALTSLAGTARRLERLALGLTPKQAAARPAPDKWSVKELLCHLADCELVYALRYRKILAEPGAALVAFDQNAWASRLQYQRQPVKDSLGRFKALRCAHIGLLKSLPGTAWDLAGQHPSYGALNLRQLVVHLVDHDRNHLAQVERLVPGKGK
jgi:uncharacterized damage-inducible protein DinB